MEQLSNLDVIILIIVALSALLAFYRGLIKEVLSIIGWVLLTIIMIYVLPLLTPLFKERIESGVMAGVAASITVFVVFFILWFIFTAYVSSKIRSLKKLNFIDRFLGLFFGVMRAALLVVLCYIAIGWVIPPEEQPEFLTKSKYYTLAGTFAEPIEKMIPQETLDIIKIKDNEDDEKNDEKRKEREKELEKGFSDLFEKLAQPKVKKAEEKKKEEKQEEGYEKSERKNMDKLMENVAE